MTRKVLTHEVQKATGQEEAWTLRVPTDQDALGYLHPVPAGYEVSFEIKGATIWFSESSAQRANRLLLHGQGTVEHLDLSRLETVKHPVLEPKVLVQNILTRKSCGRK